jgi:hypothetical protein
MYNGYTLHGTKRLEHIYKQTGTRESKELYYKSNVLPLDYTPSLMGWRDSNSRY